MDAHRWYELAQEQLGQGQYHEAKDLLQNALQLEPSFQEALADLALVYIHQGDFEEALAQYNSLLELDDQIDTRIKQAGILLYLDRPQEAEQQFLSILQQEPGNDLAQKGLADSYFRQNNFKGAQELYDQLLEADDSNAFLWYSKAEAYYRAQDHEQALLAIEQAIDLQQAPEFFAFKGDFYIRHDNFERALEQYRLAANLSPKDPEIRMRLGFILRILQRPKDAIEAFDKALEFEPDHLEALENKIEILEELQQPAAALAAKEQLVRRHPNNLEAGLELTNYYMQHDGYQRAAEIFELLIDEHYDNGEIWLGLAHCLYKEQQYQQALQAVHKAQDYLDDTISCQELETQIKTQMKA